MYQFIQLLDNVLQSDDFVDPHLKVEIVGDVEAAKAVIEDKPGTAPLQTNMLNLKVPNHFLLNLERI